MKIPYLLLLSLCIFSTSFGQSDKRLKGIDKELNKILEVTKAPGFAVAIVEGDKILYAKGFGYRDIENKIPMDENTLLAIGSSTKAFTCGVLGQLRDDGQLAFTDSPRKYVKELSFYNDALNAGVNIRDLMSHQTGIPRHDFSWYLFPTFNRDSLIQRIQYQEPFTGLRQKWYYNNFMFLLQGVIAERITTKSWEDNIRERFFKPLQMTRSNLSIAELEKSSNAAIGYELYKDSISRKLDYYKIAGMAPAGSINSSVREMSNWLKVWINNGKFNGQQILPEAYVKEAMSAQAVINGGVPGKDNPDMFLANYGYGWMITSYRGHYRVEHGGNIDGFSASAAFFPTDSLGIVVLTNQGGSPVPYMVRNTVADRMLNVKRSDWSEYFLKQKKKNAAANSKEDKEENKNTSVSPSHVSSDFTGDYQHPGYGKFTISLKEDSLFAHFKRTKFYLKHVHYDVFEPFEVTEYGIDDSDTGPLRLNFDTNDMGEVASVRMKVEQALDHPIEFKHLPKTMKVTSTDLAAYVGEYEISGMTIKVYTKDENQLYLYVAGQPEYQLLASEKDLFIFKGLNGYKAKFNAGEGGKITELVLMQPNGTFKAQKK